MKRCTKSASLDLTAIRSNLGRESAGVMCVIPPSGFSGIRGAYGKLLRIPPNPSGARLYLKHWPFAKPRPSYLYRGTLVLLGRDTRDRESEVAGERTKSLRSIWLPQVTDSYEEPSLRAKVLIG
jgi:hypothetical protein